MFFKTGAFRNFPMFTGKHLCWNHFLIKLLKSYLKEASTQVFSCEFCEIFTKTLFDSKPPVAFVDLLFLTKSNVGWFLLKRLDLVIVRVIYTLLEETIPARLYWLTCRNQKLVQIKQMQQRLYALILGFWQRKQVYVLISTRWDFSSEWDLHRMVYFAL